MLVKSKNKITAQLIEDLSCANFMLGIARGACVNIKQNSNLIEKLYFQIELLSNRISELKLFQKALLDNKSNLTVPINHWVFVRKLFAQVYKKFPGYNTIGLIKSLQVLGKLISKVESRMDRCRSGIYMHLSKLRDKLISRVAEVENYIDKGLSCDILVHEAWMSQLQEEFGELCA